MYIFQKGFIKRNAGVKSGNRDYGTNGKKVPV